MATAKAEASFLLFAVHWLSGGTRQTGVCTGILRGFPANLITGSRSLASKASRCSSVGSPALPLLRDGVSSDGRCQEQEQLFVSLDKQRGHCASPSESSCPDTPEPGRRTGSETGSRCSSVWNPPLPLLRDGFSSGGRCQEHLWQQFFLDPTMWWDNRRDGSRCLSFQVELS